MFVVDRPPSYWDVVGQHLPLALVSGLVLLASALLPRDGVPFWICGFRWLTGYPCLFCGYSRAFIALGHGDAASALRNCPLALFFFALTAGVFLWNAAALALRIRIRRGPGLRLGRNATVTIAAIVTAAVTLNWIYRLYMGYR